MCNSKKCISCKIKKRASTGKLCSSCRTDRWKNNNPWGYIFNYHKQNATRRNKDWKLDFNDFMAIWDAHPDKKAQKVKQVLSYKTGDQRNKSKCTWEIDRIDNALGYIPGNCRIVEKLVNIKLYHEWKKGLAENYDISVFIYGKEETETLKELAGF